MRKQSIGKRLLTMLLAAAMAVPSVPMTASAATVGELLNVDTGLTGDIDVKDTISLPIQILDYESDGMLFEYAEGLYKASHYSASEFGATWSTDFTGFSSITEVENKHIYNFDKGTTKELLEDVKEIPYLRLSWKADISSDTSKGCAFFGRTGVIMPNELGFVDMDSVRYLVLVYRSNVESGNIGFFMERESADRNTEVNKVKDFSFTSNGETNWTYAVYDLKQGNLADTWDSYGGAECVWTTLPMDAAGEYIDISQVALFDSERQAELFGRYAITRGSDHGDNRAFGLLNGSRTETGGEAYADLGSKVNTVSKQSGASNVDLGTTLSEEELGYQLLGTLRKGSATIGLLESGLESGYPKYKEEVVTYLAGLLQHSLSISEYDETTGWKNYRFVEGAKSTRYDSGSDLATALRSRIQTEVSDVTETEAEKAARQLGSYTDTAKKGQNLIGTWDECKGYINTYHDAAYFLLNSIFVQGSYNEPQDDYDHLVLSAGIDAQTGQKVYIFDGGFTTSNDPNAAEYAVDYDTTKRTIQNSSALGKTHYYYNGSSTTTLNPFLPITDKNNALGETRSVYAHDDSSFSATLDKGTYRERNFNYVLSSKGEFVYHEDDELFFDFEGDDDVYLFINDELVMDIGSAHSIDSVRFDLNDYVSRARAKVAAGSTDERDLRLALEEGETYTFNFYYMERHGYGANMRIMTNIPVTDPSMVTEKSAYQDGVELPYGSIIDRTKIVEYGFSIENNGNENLHNLTFKDDTIGVSFSYEEGLVVANNSRVTDLQGGELDAADITFVLTHPEYDDIIVEFASNEELKNFLVNITSDAALSSGDGLWPKSKIEIRGIGYKLSEAQIKVGVFDNTVYTTATNPTGSTTLYGQASMRVFVPSDPMYYQWAGHELKITKDKLVKDVLAAASQTDNVLSNKVPNLTTDNVNKIETTTSSGNVFTYTNVSIAENNLTVNYPTAGSRVFYVKITYNNNAESIVVPVLVNITDVKDKYIVLDYGVKAELTENNELFSEDVLTVPGRDTSSSLMAINKDENNSYSPNNITFTAATLTANALSGSFGDFKLVGQTLSYVPGGVNNQIQTFMNDIDTIYAAVNVYESNHKPSALGTVDINNEVQMYKSVNVLPATIVYYEDNFPAIIYESTKNEFVPLREAEKLSQSVDQDENYGHDATYSADTNTAQSGGTITTIPIDASGQVAYFDFTGTGFELISRTNAYDSAKISVAVYKRTAVENTDGTVTVNEELVKRIPVITEFDNGADSGKEEIYQVPVIRVDDLAHGTYRVKISGVPTRDYDTLDKNGNPVIIPTTLYIDGIRIFQPLGATNEHYSANENGATVKELRDLIIQGWAAAADYDGEALTVGTSTITWTENLTGVTYEGKEYKGNKVETVEDYLVKGPNNEVYMQGDITNSAVVVYVKETEDSTHNLQVAIHGVDAGLFVSGGSTGINTEILVGAMENGVYGWTPLVTVTSAAEQYYTIDYTKCPYTTDVATGEKIYQVALKANSGMVSYTSLKYNGLELVNVGGEATTLKFTDGLIKPVVTGAVTEDANYPQLYSIEEQLVATALFLPESDIEPDDTVTDGGDTDDGEGDTDEDVDKPNHDKPNNNKPNNNKPNNNKPNNNKPNRPHFHGFKFDFKNKKWYR